MKRFNNPDSITAATVAARQTAVFIIPLAAVLILGRILFGVFSPSVPAGTGSINAARIAALDHI